MRNYIRLDPRFIDKKGSYPDGALAAYVAVLCYAEQQPERGVFRDLRVLRALLGRRARWISHLLAERDLVELPNGKLYVDGWAEWNEGDWKVAERVRRIRDRHKSSNPVNPINPDKTVTRVTVDVTPDVTVENVYAPLERQREAVSDSGRQDFITPPEVPPLPVDNSNGRLSYGALVERARAGKAVQ